MLKPRKSIAVQVGKVLVGGGAPVAVQSMTNEATEDVRATVAQILELAKAGSELVRITVNSEEAAHVVPEIKKRLLGAGCDVPLIGDFHFNGHLLLRHFPECAKALDKYRVNPGNVGSGEQHDANFATIIECALKYDKPVRIGANWGSLDRELLTKLMDRPSRGEALINKRSRSAGATSSEIVREAMVESALGSAELARRLGMPAEKIILSAKTSNLEDVVWIYEELAERCDYALHLGLTEAGMGMKGVIESTAALAILLRQGIGDTIRISLTPAPGEPRTREVEACQWLLQSLGLRQFRAEVTSCPGCGRAENVLFQRLSAQVNEYVERKMPEWKARRPGSENLKIAVMGCIVNGPGEAGHADVALCLPGRSEEPIGMVFIRGKLVKTLRGGRLGEEFLEMLEEFVEQPL